MTALPEAPLTRPARASAQALPRLERGALTLFGTLASTLANLAPSMAIFLSITPVAGAMGSRAPWAFAIAALATLTTGNTMAVFAGVLPSAGSFVTVISNGFGVRSRRAGAVLGCLAFYLLLLSSPLVVAAVVVFLGSWVAALFAWRAPDAWLLVGLGAIAAVAPLVLRGAGLSSRAALILFVVDAAGLAILSLGVLILARSHLAAPLHDYGGSPGGFGGQAGVAFALAIFSFIGWEGCVPLAEESARPRRDIPIAIVASIGLAGLLYVAGAWAAVVGFAAWHGPVRGLALLGDVHEAAPFLDLARHYLPWFSGIVGLVGAASALGCLLAAVTCEARIVFNGAREGLLPAWVARVSARRVPVMAVAVYMSLTALFCVVPARWPQSNPVAIFSLEAGIGTTPLLLVYVAANVALPLYMLGARRDLFNPIRHLILPAASCALLVYGLYAFVRPGQPASGATFWLCVLALLLISGVWTGLTLARHPSAVERVGSVLAD